MNIETTRGTPAWLRATNTLTAMTLFLDHGPLTRNQLGELSGLSKPTAAQLVSRLEEAGLISVSGEASGGRGPNAVVYAVNADRVVGVAIDITAAGMSAVVVDASETERAVASVAFSDNASERSAIDDVHRAIEAACAAADVAPEAVGMICIGVQAAVAHRTDQLSFTDTLPGWPTMGVRRQLEAEFGVAVTIDNDANLAAIAERAAGDAALTDGFALLWIGDGLGLAIDVGGTVYRGASGGAGEIGYLAVPAEAAKLDPAADDLTSLFGAAAYAALKESAGDYALAQLAARIALGLVPVLAVLDPECIVLGGPIGVEGGRDLAELVGQELAATSQWAPLVVATTVDRPVLRGGRAVLVAEVRERLLNDVARIAG